MARIDVNELRYALTMDPKNFLATLKRVEKESAETKGKVERPYNLKASGADKIISQIKNIAAAWLSFQAIVGQARTSMEFETNIANVATLGVKNIGELEQAILEIGSTAPIALNDLAKGLYEVVSAGVDANEQIRVLELSAQAGKAGLAQTTDALNLASAVVKSYGLSWAETEEILDKAFQTVNLGQTTFPALAKEIGKVAPLAATLKITTDELFGSFAALTGVTGNTSEVATQLRAILADIVEPTAALAEIIREAGYASGELLLKSEGLAGFFKLIQKETGGSAAAMSNLFGRVEAVNAAIALSSTQYDSFVEKTRAMAASAGSLGNAFEIQSQTLESQIQVLKNNFDILSIALLKGLVPAIDLVVGNLAALIKAFNELDPWAQKTIVGINLLTVVLLKGRAAVLAIRAAILTLNASLGPTGWLILGISAAATALTFYAGSAEDAEAVNSDLKASNLDVADSFDKVTQAAYQELKVAPVNDLITLQEKLNAELDANYEKLKQLNAEFGRAPTEEERLVRVTFASGEESDPEKDLRATQRLQQRKTEIEINETKARIAAIDKLLAERQAIENQAAGKLTEAELKELDKRKEYEFQTQRISLAQYVAYLESRRAALRASLGAENVEFLKFSDNLEGLKVRLRAEVALENIELPELAEIRAPEINLDNVAKPYTELREVQTEFQAETFAALEEEYNRRMVLSNTNLAVIASIHEEESDIYQAELKKRQEMERNFQAARIALAQQGAAAVIDLTAQFTAAFQGTSRALFEVGKAASVAQAIINTYEGATKAIAAYPPPFNAIAAAATIALGFAQVAKIKATEFRAPGFAAGTRRPLTQADLIQSLFTPAGEDGLVGVRQGEFIVNADRTKEFADILQALNAGLLRREDLPQFRQGGMVQFPGGPGLPIPAYQGGGSVTNVTNIGGPAPVINVPSPGGLTREDLDRLVEAIRDVKIEIRSELDALQFFRKHYPGYERDIRKRRI